MAYCYRHPNRETFVSCSECGRPICAECMTPAPVGQRCPEHSGKPQGASRISSGMRRSAFEGTAALITKAEEHIALAKEPRSALITAAVTGQFDVRTARKAS